MLQVARIRIIPDSQLSEFKSLDDIGAVAGEIHEKCLNNLANFCKLNCRSCIYSALLARSKLLNKAVFFHQEFVKYYHSVKVNVDQECYLSEKLLTPNLLVRHRVQQLITPPPQLMFKLLCNMNNYFLYLFLFFKLKIIYTSKYLNLIKQSNTARRDSLS